MENRNQQMDVLKGIGIFCVILGHSRYIGDLRDLIYSFHMPLFFFCSGFLMYKYPNTDFKTYAKKKSLSIIECYTKFFVVSMMITYLFIMNIHDNYSNNMNWTPKITEILTAYVLGDGYLEEVPLMNYPLWYLPVYLISILVYYWIQKLLFKNIDYKKTPIFMVCLMIILLLITEPLKEVLYNNFNGGKVCFSLDVLPPALFFMLLGSLFKMYSLKDNYQKFLFNPMYIPVLFIVGIIINRIESTSMLSPNGVYILGALFILYGIYILTLGNSNSALAYLGKNSLILYGFHRPILYIIDYVVISKMSKIFKVNDLFRCFVSAFMVILLILLINLLIQKVKKYYYEHTHKEISLTNN